MFVLSLPLAAYAWARQRAVAQADLVRRLQSAPAGIAYDYEFVVASDGMRERRTKQRSSYPEPLVDWFGQDFFHTPRYLQTPLELPERFDTFNRNLLHEALTRGPYWWELNLCSHTLSSDELAMVGEQPDLESLSLDRVELPEQDLESLGKLKHLKYLSFRSTSLMHCDLRPLGKLNQLQWLDFTNCDISNQQLTALPPLPGLTRFDAVGVSTDEADCRWVRSFPNLEVLSLREAEIGDADVAHVAALSRLEYLDLNNTNITGRFPEGTNFPPSLKVMDLSDSPLESCTWLKDLPNLNYLDLGKTRLTPQALRQVEWPSSLTTLRLEGLEVDGDVLDNLEKLPDLQLLVLSQLRVEPAMLIIFKARRPDCKVVQWP